MKIRLVGCLFLASLALWGCTLPKPQAPSTSEVTQPAPTGSAVGATSAAPTDGACHYVWSSQDLPALSKSIESALQATSPQMTGSAYAYGEDCVSADGAHTFTAMETDFRVRVQVLDLKDEAKMGDSIRVAMNVIAAIPADEILGPQPGRVDYQFYKSDTEELNVSVGIDKYSQVAPGTSGADLFRLFHVGPS